MNRLLGNISFAGLLPDSIREDETVSAAAESLDGLLRKTTHSIPNLLIWARLDRQNQRLIPPLARLVEASGGFEPLSGELLELLAWQMHVDFREVAVTSAQLEGMVKNSIPWHRIKGTPASIKNALALFDLTAGLEEDGMDDYWATYQIGLPQIADIETVKLVCRVAYEMHPARCSLYRIYTNVWDIRPGTYSGGIGDSARGKGGGFYSEAAYSFYSGVPVPGLPDGGELIVSFGRLNSAQAALMRHELYMGREKLRGVTVLFGDDIQYSSARYSDSILPFNHGFVRSRLNSRVIGRPVYLIHSWDGAWDRRKWFDLVSIGHVREPFTFARRSTAAIEAVYSESAYSDLNAHYGQPVHVLVDDLPSYSESAYSDHDPLRRTHVVDELFFSARAARTDEPLAAQSACVVSKHTRMGEHKAVAAPFLPAVAGWNGGWDSRFWRSGGGYARITREAAEI